MQPTKEVVTLPIDATGEIAQFRIQNEDVAEQALSRVVAFHLRGTDTADYHVEFGVDDGAGGIYWFDVSGDYAYSGTDTIDDAWEQAEKYLRIVVDTAGAAGSTADVAVSRARGR